MFKGGRCNKVDRLDGSSSVSAFQRVLNQCDSVLSAYQRERDSVREHDRQGMREALQKLRAVHRMCSVACRQRMAGQHHVSVCGCAFRQRY